MGIHKLPDLADKAACPRLVVKIGSSLLVGREGVRRGWLEGLVAEIAAARTAVPGLFRISLKIYTPQNTMPPIQKNDAHAR